MESDRPDLLLILRTLVRHRVEFIIVGGVCGVLHGAPISTFDLDLVHSRTPENIRRLLAALKELDAHYRDPAERVIYPDKSHLSSPGHQLLLTSGGPLDLLGQIGGGRDYQDLLAKSVTIQVSNDLEMRMLGMEALIQEKEEMDRDKDRAVLPVLRRTLEEKKKGGR